MDDKDRQLLGFLRKGINLTSRPFQDLAAKIGADSGESEIFLRMISLREKNLAGSLTVVLNSQLLAYQSVWVAAKLPGSENEFDRVAARINEYPGVIKSQRRAHDFNFWFTLILPSVEPVEDHLHRLRQVSGSEKLIMIPLIKRFKAGNAVESFVSPGFLDFSNQEIEILRKIQEELPLLDRPFQKWARDLEMTETDFLENIKDFVKRGIVRRFAMIFPAEEKLSASQNMLVWQVPEEKQDAIAASISSFPGVSQCDRRRVLSEFPYPLVAFFSSKTESVEETVLGIQKKIGKWPWVSIPVVSELKNSRPFYFPKDLEPQLQTSEQILKEV